MEIKTFIEKAIEGGWVYRGPDTVLQKSHATLNPSWILLQPEAWKAVGKVEGWYCDVHKNSDEPGSWGHSKEECADWKNRMHRMIDALAEGKTIKEFIATL